MNTTSVSVDVRKELARIVGDVNFREGAAGEHLIDGMKHGCKVAAGDAEQVAAVLRFASENDLVIVPHGGGTMQSAGYMPERIDILLSTERLNKVLHYDAGDLTLSVGAGMKLAELHTILAKYGQFLPLDAPTQETATVGGTLAANVCGPLQVGYGSARDFCIGIEFVTGDGVIARGGGRVVKNVAGYDMMKLLIGSHGTLGVITSANFKVFPMPNKTRTFVCEFSSTEELAAFFARVTISPFSPMRLEVVSPMGMEYVSGQEAVRNPDHYAPSATLAVTSDWRLYICVAGSEAVLKRYRNELGAKISKEIIGSDEEKLWHRISNWRTTVAERHPHAMHARLWFPMNATSIVLKETEQCAVENNLLFACVGRPSVGNMSVAFVPIATDPASSMQYANTISALRAALPAGCGVSVTRCPLEAKARFDVWGAPQADVELMRDIRRAMDPQMILNRGRYIV